MHIAERLKERKVKRMTINFDKVERLNIRVSSYDFKYDRLFNRRRFYYKKPLEESASVSFIFNDTKLHYFDKS